MEGDFYMIPTLNSEVQGAGCAGRARSVARSFVPNNAKSARGWSDIIRMYPERSFRPMRPGNISVSTRDFLFWDGRCSLRVATTAPLLSRTWVVTVA